MPRYDDFMQMNLLDAPDAAAATGQPEDGEPQRPKRERLQSLDALRGLNVIVMMFVDDTWIDELDHASWDGAYHLADFVMPTFLLMVGASMSFSMRKCLLRETLSFLTVSTKHQFCLGMLQNGLAAG